MDDDNQPRDVLLEEAFDWLFALEAAPTDPALDARFQAWLAHSEAHRLAWNKARKSWDQLGRVTPDFEHVWRRKPAPSSASSAISQRNSSQRNSATRIRPRLVLAGAAAALAAIFLFMATPAIMLRLQADQITGTGELRTVALADGTVVVLGPKSAISSNMTDTQRSVTLLSGEVFFDVKADAARPFTVSARDVDIRVHGTAFDVRLVPETATVALQRGAIALTVARSDSGSTEMKPGDEITVDRKTKTLTARRVRENDIGRWKDGSLFVEEARLGDVVAELQRYDTAWITVPDGVLAEKRVTGLYDLRDPERALRALVNPFGGKVRTVTPYIRVLSRY